MFKEKWDKIKDNFDYDDVKYWVLFSLAMFAFGFIGGIVCSDEKLSNSIENGIITIEDQRYIIKSFEEKKWIKVEEDNTEKDNNVFK